MSLTLCPQGSLFLPATSFPAEPPLFFCSPLPSHSWSSPLPPSTAKWASRPNPCQFLTISPVHLSSLWGSFISPKHLSKDFAQHWVYLRKWFISPCHIWASKQPFGASVGQLAPRTLITCWHAFGSIRLWAPWEQGLDLTHPFDS